MPGCTKGCGKKKKKQDKWKARRMDANKSVATEYVSDEEDPSDLDSMMTVAGDYETLPSRSNKSILRKKGSRTAREVKSKGSRKKIPDDYSERSYVSTATEKGHKQKRKSPRAESSDEYSSETTTKTSGQCAAVSLSKFIGGQTSETESFDDDDDGRGCEDEECGRDARARAASRRKKVPSESSESSSEELSNTDDSEKCPELCETDPSKLPDEKPTKCDSFCRRQAWLKRQRQKKQDEIDDYLLRKGFRYFDDMCKCSFKCLMSQICVDPFVRNVALSTFGFFLGVKLCWELDGFYVLF